MSRSIGCCARLLVIAITLLAAASSSSSRAATPGGPAAPPAPATRPAAGSADFGGEWDSSYGLLVLKQTGDAVEGTYPLGGGPEPATVSGKVTGRRLTFTYLEPGVRGEGWFELAPDGRSFAGRWRPLGAPGWGTWEGRKRVARTPRGPFDGLWQTEFGRMRLRQEGNAVRGVYELGGRSTVTGTVADGKTLAFTYEQPDGEEGSGTFKLADDGKSFAGTWKSTAGAAARPAGYGGAWTGQRIIPKEGRIWLVVLEAPWEAGLEQEEYAFGLMLRTFFARVPGVEVRHKAFHSEKDLRRWCAELPYLAEPVVLHISSHGTEQGVTAGGETIGAKALAECLRDAGDLRLVHFGSCLVCAGDVPRQIHAALGPEAASSIPISGYKRTADWAGSAVVDFTYLELVLARRMSPAQAAEETRRMLTFAREPGAVGAGGGVIAPMGLVVIEAR